MTQWNKCQISCSFGQQLVGLNINFYNNTTKFNEQCGLCKFEKKMLVILFYNKSWLCLYDMRMNHIDSGNMEPNKPLID